MTPHGQPITKKEKKKTLNFRINQIYIRLSYIFHIVITLILSWRLSKINLYWVGCVDSYGA